MIVGIVLLPKVWTTPVQFYAYATWSTHGMIGSAAARYFRANPISFNMVKFLLGNLKK